MHSTLSVSRVLGVGFLFLAAQAIATDVWNGPPFSADAATLRQAAEAVQAEKHSEATVLLDDVRFDFDETGKLVETRHLIYRVENQEGVENWAETSGRWEAWHQAKPEIKARVITPDGTTHWIDPKTLNDVPVHEDAPELYTDARRFGGPLPAVAPGVIVEEQVIVRDTAPLFAAGTVERWGLAWSVPVHKTHIVVSHPDALPLHYQLHLLPDATVTKSHENGVEVITLDQGPLPAFTQQPDHVPPDLVLRPEFEFSTGKSWQEVAAEYLRLSDDKLRAADVQPLLATLNLKDGHRDDIIRRVTAVLHQNVRYTGVEFGESSLVPQYPSETLKRKYGDCKDKAALLAAMLRAAGISANLALLDSGPGRDINADLPGMGMFDHAIVYVPASGSDADLWIDATAQYSQVGTLPWMDYGRWALVVGDKTESLRQTPKITATQNLHREFREFTLAEYGKATIAEIDDEVGPEEADYRAYYMGDSKQVRESSENYVKDMYLADSLTSLEHGDLADLAKPSSIKFLTKGKRGNTDLTRAVVAIRVEELFDRLPQYFRTEEKTPASDQSTETAESEATPPRTADWWVTPFATEWQYKIVAPLGFKLRALPPDKNDKVDTLSFTQKYSSNSDGTIVEAVLRVEGSTTRMTPTQAKALRDAVVKVRSSDPIFITFDHVGQALIASGKIKEGLAAYAQIASQHPKEALHKVQLAQALLNAGLGEQARVLAHEATTMDPNSALAFSTLALVLKHDQIGRLLKQGMDYEGAVAAYRKAVKLDPKDKDSRANLALLLEYDAAGVRYAEDAPLKDAVAELRELKKLDADYSRTYEDNVLYDLWYAHDYQAVLDYAATLPTTEVRKGLTLAATAVLQGTDAALKRSMEITTEEQVRSQALLNAGAVLLRVRKYHEASVVFSEAARGQSNGSQLARSAAIFANTRPYSELKVDLNDPRGVVQQLFSQMLSGKLTLAEFNGLTYADPQTSDAPLTEPQFQAMMSSVKGQVQTTSLPITTIADLALSNMHYTVGGDDSLGYKIIVEAPGSAAQNVFVLRDGSHYKIAAFSMTDNVLPEELASVALREMEKNNLVAARNWLDRARDEIHMGGSDDPLGGTPFPYFWTKGQDADISVVRTAAFVLLPSKQLKNQYFSAVAAARDSAQTDLDRARLTMVLAYAYSSQDRWAEMLPLTLELTRSYPTSLRAFDLAVSAYAGLKRFDDWEKLVDACILQHPEELAYVRSSARLAAYRGQFVKAREIIKTISDKGQATGSDLNLYAWYALALPTPIEQETIDLGIRANDLTKNASFAILHTLGCVYAQAGKTSEARELLLKAMDAQHIEQPNSEIWFGFALIAEQYGVVDAAQKMFDRVEKPKADYPATTYEMAQQHLSALRKAENSSVARSGF